MTTRNNEVGSPPRADDESVAFGIFNREGLCCDHFDTEQEAREVCAVHYGEDRTKAGGLGPYTVGGLVPLALLAAARARVEQAEALLREARESVIVDKDHIGATRGKESQLYSRIDEVLARIDDHFAASLPTAGAPHQHSESPSVDQAQAGRDRKSGHKGTPAETLPGGDSTCPTCGSPRREERWCRIRFVGGFPVEAHPTYPITGPDDDDCRPCDAPFHVPAADAGAKE